MRFQTPPAKQDRREGSIERLIQQAVNDAEDDEIDEVPEGVGIQRMIMEKACGATVAGSTSKAAPSSRPTSRSLMSQFKTLSHYKTQLVNLNFERKKVINKICAETNVRMI